ncbi:hypothetical protein BBJ29_003043 [Phytophthora kernoviae]|uniref:peptidyl-tRNA hydrolase n=1 Tax=Phytophthora kernoviae TaxID=325452 RepID=A0A421FYY0_9STRA|nr:hypothetical protein BBJ29_003043 [Phytophthora kernoviae]
MLLVWRRQRLLRRGNVLASAFSSSGADTDSDAEISEKTVAAAPKYDHVRKLIVGLGNPGDKFVNTRHNIGFMAVNHFLHTYISKVTGQQLELQHEASSHGDVTRFRVGFQQNAPDKDYVYPIDDLVNRSSKRAKDRTLKEGVPHEEVNVALLLPTTYMNCSGTAVRGFMQTHRWRLKKNPLSLNRQDELLVVTDDVALPFGECRFKAKGGPGGQNGIRDIIKCVGTERFARLRVGVGAPHWFVGGNTGAPAGTAMDKHVLGRFNGDEQEAMPDLLKYTNELLRLYLHRGVAQATTYANSMDLQRFMKQYAEHYRLRTLTSIMPLPPVPVLVSQKDLPRAVAFLVLGYAAVAWLVLQMDDYFAADDQDETFNFPKIGIFVSIYTALMVIWRFYEHGTYILYEILWACNVSLFLVAMGLYLSKPFLMVTVSGNQLLWYIDAISFVLQGKFITGAMKYLTYPENRSFSKTFFATHHIWFLPVCLYITNGHGGMHGSSFVASSILTTALAAFCRMTTPFEVRVPGSDHVIYLNVNGAYEFWKDIDIPLLHLLDHHHPLLYLPFLAIVGNFVANGFPHILVLGIALGLQFSPLLNH